MHILIFHQYFVSNAAAGGTRTYELGRRWVSQGHRVSIISGSSVFMTGEKQPAHGLLWWQETVDGIAVIRLRVPFGNTKRFALRALGFLWFIPVSILAALRVSKPDVVLATSTPLTIGIPGYIVSCLLRVPFIFELRDLWPDCVVDFNIVRNGFMVRFAYWLESFLYAKADVLVTVTQAMREKIVQKRIPRDKIHVVTNGSDLELFTPDGGGADFGAVIDGLPPHPFISLFLGNLGEAYDLGVILDAASELCDDGKFHFVFLGAGRQRAALAHDVKKRGLANVHFLDPVPKVQVPGYLRSSDIGLITYIPRKYSYLFVPIKFYDHLACGCPVILNYGGEAKEWIEGANAGIYVPPSDARALARTIRDLATNPEVVHQMRKNARLLAEKEFGWERKEEEYRPILKQAMNSSNKHG